MLGDFLVLTAILGLSNMPSITLNPAYPTKKEEKLSLVLTLCWVLQPHQTTGPKNIMTELHGAHPSLLFLARPIIFLLCSQEIILPHRKGDVNAAGPPRGLRNSPQILAGMACRGHENELRGAVCIRGLSTRRGL